MAKVVSGERSPLFSGNDMGLWTNLAGLNLTNTSAVYEEMTQGKKYTSHFFFSLQ